MCSSLAANKTIEPQAEAPLIYLGPVRLLYDPSLSFDVLHYFILYSFSNFNLTRDHGCNGQVRSDRSRSVDSMDRWRVSCSPDRGTFLVNSTPIKLDMPRLMVWTMINWLILFDTEFKVSDFFFPPILLLSGCIWTGLGWSYFIALEVFKALFVFFLWRCGGLCILSGLFIWKPF